MTLDDALLTFFAESRGLLEEMEEALLRLETAPDDAEALNAVFRAAHTIKGSAGLFGLDAVVAFTHVAESVLDRARSGELAVGEQLIGLFLACRDHMGMLIDAAAGSSPLSPEHIAAGEQLAARLSALLSAGRPQAAALPAEQPATVTREGGMPLAGDLWHLSLRFGPESLRDGMDPLSILRYLGTLGDIVHLVTVSDALPAAAEMDPEACYLGFEIGFRSEADKARIEGAFEFVREDSLVRILPPGSRIQDYKRLIEELPEDKTRLGELLVASGALTSKELDEMLREQASTPTGLPLGGLLVEQRLVQPELVDAALAKQQEARNRQAREAASVRVQADKLDQLINLVGELVISGAGVGMLASRYEDSAMQEAVSGLAHLVEDIRDSALRLRMVEIGETFSRFRRVVRDVSKELGKDIELVISGAETELDKTVVERIGDPLTHLVRNAMDHGIESAETRIALGKPARGQLTLNAYHESGGIVIEVSDDGRGLDRERILAKARERGLIDAGSEPSDSEVWSLIFEPGFSTAEQVSNLSGRGVGMDVVKRNIDALRGSVAIESRPGLGSTFRVHLPLTLAIIDGFLIGVAGDHYVVPLDMVMECVELEGTTASDRPDYLNLRGEVLPLLGLREHFELAQQDTRRQSVVVVRVAGRKAGLVVDTLEGELQAVIKPLGRMFQRLRGIAGSTILGSGEVALVLDVPTLLEQAAQAHGRQLEAQV